MEKRKLVDVNHPKLSIRQQCQLMSLNRSHLYYHPVGESEYNLLLMRLIDEEYTRYPFKGVMKMTAYLKDLGHSVNSKRIRRLLRLMGLEAIYPKRNLSKSQTNHKKYPYLLNGLDIKKPNQVWCGDITYIRLAQGFVYLTAVMDWFSRFVLSWKLSNSLEAIVHYQFESIHSFYDGNGRTGRIINILYLVFKALLNLPAVYLSRCIIENKSEYYKFLQKVRDQNECIEWILFMLTAVQVTSRQTILIIKKIKALMDDYRKVMREEFSFYSQEL